MSYACRNLQWIDANPCLNLLKLKERPKKRRILNTEETKVLLAACRQSSNLYLYCIVLIAITTGMRKGEILALTWDAIDFDNKIALIKESKNGRSRFVPLMESVIVELRKLQSVRDPFKPLIFASKTAFGSLDIKKSWQRALEKAGIKDFVLHGLRHQFASSGGSYGANSQQLRSQLGHSSSQMTDHYTHLDADATRYIGEKIEHNLLGEIG